MKKDFSMEIEPEPLVAGVVFKGEQAAVEKVLKSLETRKDIKIIHIKRARYPMLILLVVKPRRSWIKKHGLGESDAKH